MKIAVGALSCNIHVVQKGNMRTYRMTNFRGFSDRTGNRAKQMTKQARAPRLQAPKMSNRSHRLTVEISPKATKSASLLGGNSNRGAQSASPETHVYVWHENWRSRAVPVAIAASFRRLMVGW